MSIPAINQSISFTADSTLSPSGGSYTGTFTDTESGTLSGSLSMTFTLSGSSGSLSGSASGSISNVHSGNNPDCTPNPLNFNVNSITIPLTPQ